MAVSFPRKTGHFGNYSELFFRLFKLLICSFKAILRRIRRNMGLPGETRSSTKEVMVMKLCCMTVPKSSHTFEALGGTHGGLRVGMHPHGRLWRAMIAHHVDMMGAA